MRSDNSNSSVKHRLLYGAVVGAIFGMFIGTMPGNDPILGTLGLLAGAATVGSLCAVSQNFWESLQSAWELLRISFWRW